MTKPQHDRSAQGRFEAPGAQTRNFTIKVRGQTFGLPVECVKTIFHIDQVTPVPLAPREIAGVANLRGRIVTALRLDRCLDIDDGGVSDSALAVCIEHNGERYALLIDDTGDVVTCDDDDRIACPTHVGLQFIETTNACYRLGDDFLPILDIDALLRRLSKSSDSGGRETVSRDVSRGGEI
ncbi:chemotaxis protein CheW [Methylosinus sp. Ce-a6]|uniref:chemotaxis protein CheW n=1 Tax=Methylosinus sp. Ce-a6 TaxID=2172005 RepID=UPI00135A132F|nr:chemotaxis protein CheW [Methylosinus sp. Ce-a6]